MKENDCEKCAELIARLNDSRLYAQALVEQLKKAERERDEAREKCFQEWNRGFNEAVRGLP